MGKEERQNIQPVAQYNEDGNIINSINPMSVSSVSGELSVENISIVPLATGTTFTGEGEQNLSDHVMVSCQTDQAGTLFFEFSVDNVNWGMFPVAGFNVAPNVHEFHTAVKGGRYFRVRLVNLGAVAETFLRLYTYYGNNFLPSNAPLNQSIGADADAVITRGVATSIDLAFGNFMGMEEDAKYGGVKGIDAADATVDVWRMADDSFGNRLNSKTFPTVAQSLFISSDSVSDTDVDVEITYLDSIGARQTITINLNGQTAVSVGVTALDCNRLEVANENINVGNVYLNTADAHTSGVPDDLTTILAFIPATKGQSQQAIDQVPLNFKYHIKHVTGVVSRASGAAGSADIELQVKTLGGSWVTKRDYPINTGQGVNKPSAGLVFDALTKIRARLIDVSDNDTEVTFEWEYDLLAV